LWPRTIVTNRAKSLATITNAASGAFSYTPKLNATGSDSFTFKVSDGSLDSNVATVTVTTNGLSKRLTTTPRW
jgi:hypothetical protein